MSEDNPTTDPAEQTAEIVPAARTDMSVPEMREWLRNWIANATAQSPDGINESAPMVELGLSSRDAVAMASDIEDLTGVALTATVAFRHPTIEALAQVIVEGRGGFMPAFGEQLPATGVAAIVRHLRSFGP